MGDRDERFRNLTRSTRPRRMRGPSESPAGAASRCPWGSSPAAPAAGRQEEMVWCTRSATSALAGEVSATCPSTPAVFAASVELRHLPHADQRVRPGPQHQLLQGPDPGPVLLLRRREDPLPQPPDVVLVDPPVDGVPVRHVLGPFTVTVSNLSLGSGGVISISVQRLTCPRQHPFGPSHQARYPASYPRRSTEASTMSPRFPVVFRPPAFASWASCSRRGVPPSSRSAYRQPAPDPTGLPRSAHRDTTGWVPPLPRDERCSHDRSNPSAAARRLPAASPYHPAPHPISGALHYEASSRVHSRSPARSSPRLWPPGWNGGPWALPRASHPAGTRDARQGGDRHRALARSYTTDIGGPPSCAHSNVRPRVARSART